MYQVQGGGTDMAITEYEDQIQSIINEPNHEEFIYDFLSVYEKIPKATITKLKKGLNNLSKEPGEVYLKNKLYFKQTDLDLMQAYVDVQTRVNELATKPRFIIVTDYNQLLAKDTKTNDTLDIEFSKLPQKFEFFLAWNGIEKADFDKENPADVRAAERFAKLYDVVVKDNPDASRKGLNLFLIRILFCLFAEDTNIFANNLFTNRVKQMTQEDGSDFDAFVSQLFGVLDFEKSQRPVDTPSWLNDFPYVDGDLFKAPHESLEFSSKSRKLIIDAGELLNWNQVNPDILGSMIQAVASEDSRSHLGMHYTSVPNIMKVIKPLFLDGLRDAFEAAKGNEDKLQKLYNRIGNIKFMDPACGSGNFLIITYKELRQLEIDILKELNNLGVATMYVPSVTLNQFYGIEIEDFACDVTRLSLWIAEHQMNVKLHEEISDAVRPTLPLQHAGAIVNGNALELEWTNIMSHEMQEEVYLFGNPPYLGYSLQNKEQRSDIKQLFDDISVSGYLDYCCGWIMLAYRYVKNSSARFSFVTTNSICQGIQVYPLWNTILKELRICFAYQSFKWRNNAKSNAGVTVIIVGLEDAKLNSQSRPQLYTKLGMERVRTITPYLTSLDKTVIVQPRDKSISNLPKMLFGSKAVDGGGLNVNQELYKEQIAKNPGLKKYFRPFIGANELYKGTKRYVLWLSEKDWDKEKGNEFLQERMKIVFDKRTSSKKSATRTLANTPYVFAENRNQDIPALVVPGISKESRLYVPMAFIDDMTVVANSANVIYDAPVWLMGLLESRMHMVWLQNIGGSLESRYRYSDKLIYNTFPVPQLSTRRKNEIETLTYNILDIREEDGGTLNELYGSPLAEKNPKPMNERLLKAHSELDEVIDRAYKADGFMDDAHRLTMLLKMYEEKVQALGE